MPIKTAPNGEISYFIDYEPYTLPDGQEEPREVRDMVSVDVQPSTSPSTINYYIGAENSYTLTVTFKNLTNNTILDVRASVPPYAFTSNEARLLPSTPNLLRRVIEIVLEPQEVKTINMSLDKNELNASSQARFDNFSIPYTVRNRKNGTIVTKNINVTQLEQITLPETITIT